MTKTMGIFLEDGRIELCWVKLDSVRHPYMIYALFSMAHS